MMSAPIAALLVVLVIVATDLVIGWLDVQRAASAQSLLDKGSPYIDVDPPERFAAEHPRGSINMPYPHIEWLSRHLDRRVPLVVHGHRFRAILAAYRLRACGFAVMNLGSARI